MEYEEKDVVCVGITMATDYHFIKATEVSKSEKFDVSRETHKDQASRGSVTFWHSVNTV